MTQSEWEPQEPGDTPQALPPGAPIPAHTGWGDKPVGYPGPWPPEKGSPFLAAALSYAARGWRVHPLVPGDKKALLKGWPEQATTDAAIIIGWWTQWPTANVGLVPGPRSDGLAVVDVDPRNGGLDTLDRLRQELIEGQIPVTPMVRTGSGGYHLYFDARQWFAKHRALPTTLGPGIDVHAHDNLNIVAPPSVHPSGPSYVWLEEYRAQRDRVVVQDVELVRRGQPIEQTVLAAFPYRWLDLPGAVGTTGPKAKIKGTGDVADARRYLAVLDAWRADEYGSGTGGWLDVGMALHSVSEDLLPDWEAWSRQSSAFKDGACADKWAGFGDKDGGLTIGSLKRWAEEDAADVTWFSDIKEEVLTWLWPDVIPYGKLSLVIGDPGWGKSYLTLDLAARLSAGKPLPDQTVIVPQKTLLVFYEDDPGDTVKPRLRVSGAVQTQIGSLRIKVPDGGSRLLNLDTDLRALEHRLMRTGARLVVLDPLTAYLGGEKNSWKDDEMRRLLGPVAQLAQRTKCAIVGIMHLNKKATPNVLQRITGAMAFGGVARSVYWVGPHPDDSELPPVEQRRVFSNAKQNLGPGAEARMFRIVSETDAVQGKLGRFVWEGTTKVTAKDMAMADLGVTQPADKRSAAAALIQATLASGPRPAADVYKLGADQGIGRDTMERARKGLKVVDKPYQAEGQWWWRLRAEQPPPPDPDDDLPF